MDYVRIVGSVVMRTLYTILAMMFPLSLFATAQDGEYVTWKGKCYEMLACPLAYNSVLDNLFCEEYKPSSRTTADWRGYTGYWSIKDEELYLDSICYFSKSRGYQTLVPDTTELFSAYHTDKGTKATWVNCELNVVSGRCIRYVHFGFDRNYEHEDVLQLTNGKVTGVTHYENFNVTDDIMPSFMRCEEVQSYLKKLYPKLKGEIRLYTQYQYLSKSEAPTGVDIEVRKNDFRKKRKYERIVEQIRSYIFERKLIPLCYVRGEYVSPKEYPFWLKF